MNALCSTTFPSPGKETKVEQQFKLNATPRHSRPSLGLLFPYWNRDGLLEKCRTTGGRWRGKSEGLKETASCS